MTTLSDFTPLLLVAALLALPLAQAATLPKADYEAGKARIGAAYKADRAACAALSANAKDICIEEAKAKEKVERAELNAAYSGKPADAVKARVAKAEAAYAVAKEKCDAMAGDAKASCIAAAKAQFGQN